jgi:hypothetical protein
MAAGTGPHELAQLQKLEHREQRIALEDLLGAVRHESERVERLEQAIRDTVGIRSGATGSDRHGFSCAGAAARPYSTKRRIASLRDSIALALHHLLIATITGFGRRTVTAVSRPVAGRPRPRFFWCTVIDFDIF